MNAKCEIQHEPPRSLSRKPAEIVKAALAMKREDPRWGAGLIRLYLSEAYEQTDVPSEWTLQRWFRAAGLQRSPAAQQPRQTVQRRESQSHEIAILI